MILYLDSASIVKRYALDEIGTEETRRAVSRAAVVATARIAYAEVRSALARAHRENRFSPGQYDRAVTDFEADWNRFYRLGISDPLVRLAGMHAERHALRGYDAVHLACALLLQDRVPESVEMSTWDRRLAAAAIAERLALAHPVTP